VRRGCGDENARRKVVSGLGRLTATLEAATSETTTAWVVVGSSVLHAGAVDTAMILSFREKLSTALAVLPKYKVITYIDGFNLYFGIRWEAIKKGSKSEPNPAWYRYLWLDLHAMGRLMLTDRQELIATKYFTAPITGRRPKQARQNAYLDALRTIPEVEITFGRFEPNRNECDRCGHPAYHPQEKKTDVNIATALICDALGDKFDTAILVTGDSDLVPALAAVKRLKPDKRLVAAFPPNRHSTELEKMSDARLRIWEPLLRKSRLPEIIKREGLPDIVCPHKYSGMKGCTAESNPADANQQE
jgi:uncharacterized LabA/DUF88 family protein